MTSPLPIARVRHACRALLLMLALLCALPAAAQGQVARTPHVTADLIVRTAAIRPGEPFTVGLRLRMIPGWHSYWLNPGDAGVATTIDWQLPKGFSAGPIAWPAPRRIPLGDVMNYGYEGEVTLLTQVTAPAGLAPGTRVPLKAHVTWLVCKEVCIPEEGDVAANVAVAESTLPDPANAAAFAAADAALPRAAAGWRFAAERTAEGYRLVGTPPPGVPAPASLFFYASDENVLTNGATQPSGTSGGRVVASLVKSALATGPASRLRGVWVADEGWSGGVRNVAIDVAVGAPGSTGASAPSVAAPAPASGGLALLGTVGLALLGGLILNLMPCVFPVIGLKIIGFVNQAGAERRGVALHGLAFSAGVLLSFWGLAAILAVLRAGGDQLGWGFQLQSPAFVFALAAVMLTFAMNMSGAFEFGVRATAVGQGLQTKQGLVGSFFTGFLATVVATPCSAPFLAPALGAAVALPTAQSFLVFTAIGVGLALPYLLLSLFPQAVRLLPRPGRWMETFKQAMAFPLYATVAYLLWVLGGQLSDDGFLNAALALVLLAAGLWAYGRWSVRGGWRVAFASLAVMVLAGAWLGWPRGAALAQAGSAQVAWEEWSPQAVERLRAENRTIYVDFTARWCATCQVNKKLVFHDEAVLRALADKRVALLRADWTAKDPRITAELARYGRSAIPFNLVYKPGRAEPEALPELLTPGIVLRAIG